LLLQIGVARHMPAAAPYTASLHSTPHCAKCTRIWCTTRLGQAGGRSPWSPARDNAYGRPDHPGDYRHLLTLLRVTADSCPSCLRRWHRASYQCHIATPQLPGFELRR
jgi:hypothetical protein